MTPDETQETFIELGTAVVLLVLLVLWLLGPLRPSWAMLLGAVTIIGSGVYQTRRGWAVHLSTWVMGLILLLGGLGMQMFVVFFFRVSWLAFALLAVGGYIVWSNVRSLRRGSRR